ncbi:hypothetical protein [Helicobacter bilis]|nr:hypothetical protein [Helicobacter bilis]
MARDVTLSLNMTREKAMQGIKALQVSKTSFLRLHYGFNSFSL